MTKLITAIIIIILQLIDVATTTLELGIPIEEAI